LALALACNSEDQSTAPPPAHDRIRQLVANHASVELVLFGAAPVESSGVFLEERILPEPSEGRVFTAWLQRDHWHPYVVLVHGDRLLPLGGFHHPDLIGAAEHLRPGTASVSTIRHLSQQLAALGDHFGAVRYVIPSGAPAHPMAVAWNRVRSEQWPKDTVIRLPDGGWRAVVTLVSQDTRSYALSWAPTVYSFVFSSRGLLEAWARRSGELLENAPE
jgi:hypothetical protein